MANHTLEHRQPWRLTRNPPYLMSIRTRLRAPPDYRIRFPHTNAIPCPRARGALVTSQTLDPYGAHGGLIDGNGSEIEFERRDDDDFAEMAGCFVQRLEEVGEGVQADDAHEDG